MNHMVVCHNPQQAHQVLTQSLWPWIKEMTAAGHKLVIRGEELEDDKSDRQRRYYHGVILTEIAQQARTTDGQRHPMPVWKEYFRQTYLGSKRKTFTDPLTGKKSRRLVRVSTEDLGIKKYGELIDRVTAFAVTDLGVEFSVKRWEDYQ